MLVLAVKGGVFLYRGGASFSGDKFFCGGASFSSASFGGWVGSFVWNGWEIRSFVWNGMSGPVGLRTRYSPLPPPVGSSLARFLFPTIQARRVVVLLRIRGASFSGCIRGASFGTLTR